MRPLAHFGLAAMAVVSLSACSMFQKAAPTTERYAARLNGASEVPSNATTGTGSATAVLDLPTKVLTYTVEYSGLTGPVTMAHFHGPAAVGQNAGPAVNITAGPSPIRGTATLTDAQIAQLQGGQWYVNLHTAANRAGEIRGQVTKAN